VPKAAELENKPQTPQSKKKSKRNQVVEEGSIAKRKKVDEPARLVLCLDSSEAYYVRRPDQYILNTIVVVPATSENLVAFLSGHEFDQIGHVSFSNSQSLEADTSFALFKRIDVSHKKMKSKDEMKWMRWELPAQLQQVNRYGSQLLRPEECVKQLSGSVFQLPTDVRRKYLSWSLEVLILVSNVVNFCKSHGRALESVTAASPNDIPLVAAILVVCSAAGGFHCEPIRPRKKEVTRALQTVEAAIDKVKQIKYNLSKFLLLISFLAAFPKKIPPVDSLSQTSSASIATNENQVEQKLVYDASLQGVKCKVQIAAEEVVAIIDHYTLCAPMHRVPHTLRDRIATDLGALQIAIHEVPARWQPVLFAKRNGFRPDLQVNLQQERTTRKIEKLVVTARHSLTPDDGQLFIDCIGEPVTLESLAGVANLNQLTGTLQIYGEVKDLLELSADRKEKCDLQLTGTVLQILPKMIEEGKRFGCLGGEPNQTYNVIPEKRDSHMLVRVAQLPPRFMQLVEILTDELNAHWVEAHNFPKDFRALQLVMQDASQTSNVKVDRNNPLGHFTGPLCLYDFEEKKFDKRGAEDDAVMYLAPHMDGAAGGTVLTVVIQIPAQPEKEDGQDEKPATATPTVFSRRVIDKANPEKDLLALIQDSEDNSNLREKLLVDVTEAFSCELPDQVDDVPSGRGSLFKIDRVHTSAGRKSNIKQRIVLTWQLYYRTPTKEPYLLWLKTYGILDWRLCAPGHYCFGTWVPLHNPNRIEDGRTYINDALKKFADSYRLYLEEEKKALEDAVAQEEEDAVTQEEKIACSVCGSPTWSKGNDILLCSFESCATGAHVKCAKLEKVPEGDWFCELHKGDEAAEEDEEDDEE
jgi:hypothetical protein